jgi:methylthioribose-1-phosphate isomerase
MKNLSSIIWKKNKLDLLDQRKIPKEKSFISCDNLESVIECIKKMIVRGAPAIAITGLFGLVLELKTYKKKSYKIKEPYSYFLKRVKLLLESRPTAINLKLAIDDFLKLIDEKTYTHSDLDELIFLSEKFAVNYFEDDLEANLQIGENGTKLFSNQKKSLNILTHCNTGALATAGHGTALGIIRSLRDKGFDLTIYADETRPYQQGSRLTAWEMEQEKIKCFILAEGMAAYLMNSRKIDAVIVGADRIAPNGDTANKIGTYTLAILAKEFKIPFYVAATKTSFDFKIKTGKEIPIEMRKEEEITQNSFLMDLNGKPYLPKGVLSPVKARAINPSFDITPVRYISAIITELGIIRPVTQKKIRSIILN